MSSISEMPTTADLIRTVKEFSLKFSHIPTALVMTHDFCAKLAKLIPERPDPMTPADINNVYGVPIESYATAGECLDRMLSQHGNERLQLVTCKDDAFAECMHTFWREVLLSDSNRFLPVIFLNELREETP